MNLVRTAAILVLSSLVLGTTAFAKEKVETSNSKRPTTEAEDFGRVLRANAVRQALEDARVQGVPICAAGVCPQRDPDGGCRVCDNL